jgi:ribosomal protein S18 acetylase RimI-like enzyme
MTTRAIEIRAPRDAADWARARDLVDAYVASLGIDLGYQGFDAERERLAIEYAPPDGAFFLAFDGTVLVGCAGLRRFDADTGEVKRMYVRDAARGRGVGRHLVDALVAAGRRLGYARLVLDSWPSMQAAQALYRSAGFTPIAPYRYSPVADTAYFALRLA